jgi:hypothetical protein
MTGPNPDFPEFDSVLTKQHWQIAKQFLGVHEQGSSLPVFLRLNAAWLLLK